MASRGYRGGAGERVLESKHVIGLFMLMLVFSGVFFALGFVMGRNQYDGQVRAAGPNPRATPQPAGTPRPGHPPKTPTPPKPQPQKTPRNPVPGLPPRLRAFRRSELAARFRLGLLQRRQDSRRRHAPLHAVEFSVRCSS